MMVATVVPIAPMSAMAVDTTYWVDVTEGSDANPGTEAEPFKTITHAVAVAWSNDTIMVHAGEYNETNGEVLPIPLMGASLIGVEGSSKTFIQGNGTDRLFTAQDFTEGDEISGFTFTGGRAPGSGGALEIYLSLPIGPGALRIGDNTFEDCRSTAGNGGAVLVFTSNEGAHNVVIEDNLFLNDHASSNGGGVHSTGYVDLTVMGNTIEGCSAVSGGAVSIDGMVGHAAVIEDNHFLSNEAANSAGALTMGGGGPHTIAGNTFLYNTAPQGGAVALYTLVAKVIGNFAGGNTTTGQGGFARLWDSEVTSFNNAIDANAASTGGGWWLGNVSTLYEFFDTVIHHEDAGQAVYANDASTLTITNSILWNPAIASDVEGADDLSHSCVSDTDVGDPAKKNVLGTGVIFDDPLIVDDATKPTPDLLPGSPCIDTATTTGMPDDDVYGTTRPLDGDGDGVAEPDMGCFEWVMPTMQIEHDAAGVTFDRWVSGYSTAYSGGGYVYGRWTGTRLDARFTGRSVKWIGPKQPGYGMADIYIDDVLAASNVDCYAPAGEATLSATIWESGALAADGSHTMSVRLTGVKNPASTGYVVVLDRLEAQGLSPQGGGTRIDDTTATPGYTGTWIAAINPTYFNKTYSYSRWTNAAFTATFKGTRVAWIGPRTTNYGMADILIDGMKVATADQYRANLATQGWRERVWESGALSPGIHMIEIRPTGTKNPAATAANIVVDAIDVTP
jgi:hypothetical protein